MAKIDYTQFYTSVDKGLQSMMSEVYEENSSQWLQFFYEADIDTRIAAGDTLAFSNYYGINSNSYYHKDNLSSYNLIRTRINLVEGHQRRNRKATAIVPQETQDQGAADDLSGIIQWVNTNCHFYEKLSKGFRGAVTCGMNLMQFWLDYTNDPVNGDVKTDVLSYNSFLIDPYFKNMDLSDCKYIWIRKWLSKNELILLFPDRKEEIMSMKPSGNRDGKFPYQPESTSYSSKNLFSYDEFYYQSHREQKTLVDTLTGETARWRGEKEGLDDLLKDNPHVVERNITIPTINLGIVINDVPFYNGPNPMGIDRYPCAPVVYYYEPEIPYFPYRVQGLVRDLRAVQFSFSRRMKLNLEYLESQINSGMKAEEDSLVNPEDAFLSGAGRVLWVKKGRMGSVEQLAPAQLPPSWFQEIEMLNGLYDDITGINQELLGASDTDTGITQLLRQSAGLTTLQMPFDKLDETQKVCAKVVMEMISENFSVEKMNRILGKEVDPIIASKAFQKFDINVVDGVMSANQRQMQFFQLMQMQQMGMQIPPELLLQTSDLQNKEDLIKSLSQQAEAQAQQQQQQTELQNALVQSQIKDVDARAVANQGLGIERLSRVKENEALSEERRAEAIKDMEQANLDKVKAIKELQTIDIENLQKTLNILSGLKLGSQIEEKGVE